jgi:Condensation domain
MNTVVPQLNAANTDNPEPVSVKASELSEVKRRLLDQYVRGQRVTPEMPRLTISRRPPGQPAPLSFAQEQMWLRSQSAGIPPLYNESITVRRRGKLNVTHLQQSLAEIIRRHEIWRTSYVTLNGSPTQQVHPSPAMFPLQVMDLRRLSERERQNEALRVAEEDARVPFDLQRGPLLRGLLLRMEDEDYRLLLTAHLSIVDGVSVYRVLPLELSELYQAFADGSPLPLPELPIQYGDYAHWQRKHLEKCLPRSLAFWRKQLGDNLPVLQWPTDRQRPPSQTFRGSMHLFSLPQSLTQAVRGFSLSHRVTLFTVLEAVFAALLCRYTDQDEIMIGTFSPCGRKRSELQGMLGHLVSPVALRIQVERDRPFRTLLDHTRQVTLEAISHDDIPLERLADELLPKRDESRNPFFTVGAFMGDYVYGCIERRRVLGPVSGIHRETS